MSSKKRVLLPPSAAGLTRYSDETKGGLHIPPEVVVALCVITILAEFYLHTL
ncbi:MAG: preprotein translocase subunit Sec61beta [archaeon]